MPTGPRSSPIPPCGSSFWISLGLAASARRHLGELRRVVADLVPARLVGHLLVEAGAKVELRHQAGGHEVDGAEVVVEAGSAVAAEVPRGQLALVGLHQVLALGEPEVFLRHHHARQAGAGPVLTTRAMAVAQRLRVLHLVLHAVAQAGPLECLRHHDSSRVGPTIAFNATRPGSGFQVPDGVRACSRCGSPTSATWPLSSTVSPSAAATDYSIGGTAGVWWPVSSIAATSSSVRRSTRGTSLSDPSPRRSQCHDASPST